MRVSAVNAVIPWIIQDELLIYLKNHNINMCPIDFGIIRTENTSISNYDVDCLQEDEIGEILITLWYKLKN